MIQYTDLSTTPMLFHKFNIYFRIPLTIIIVIMSAIVSLSYLQYPKIVLWVVLDCLYAILTIALSVVVYTWSVPPSRKCFYSIIILEWISIFYQFIVIVSGLWDSKFVFRLVGYIAVKSAISYYYYRRQPLFGFASDENESHRINSSVTEEPHAAVCPSCGAQKINGSSFCNKCGVKFDLEEK